MAEVYVLLMLVLLVLATWLLLRIGASDRRIGRAFRAASIAYFLSVIALGLIDFATLQKLSWEDHVIEWLSVEALFVAGVLAAVVLARRARRGQPCPLSAVLAAGLWLASARELAWGRPFFGRRLWYSRNLFRPQAYLDPAYFRKFRKYEGLAEEAAALYVAHIVFSAVFILAAVVLIVYVLRHRRRFLGQLRGLRARACGRYFLLGVGAYASAQMIGELFEMISESEAARRWHEAHAVLGHRVVDEPIELWGAACLLISMVTFWRDSFRSAGAGAPEAEPD